MLGGWRGGGGGGGGAWGGTKGRRGRGGVGMNSRDKTWCWTKQMQRDKDDGARKVPQQKNEQEGRKEGRKEGKSKEAGDETLPSHFSPVTSGGKGEGAVTVTTVVSVVIMVVVWLLVGLSALQTWSTAHCRVSPTQPRQPHPHIDTCQLMGTPHQQPGSRPQSIDLNPHVHPPPPKSAPLIYLSLLLATKILNLPLPSNNNKNLKESP